MRERERGKKKEIKITVSIYHEAMTTRQRNLEQKGYIEWNRQRRKKSKQ